MQLIPSQDSNQIEALKQNILSSLSKKYPRAQVTTYPGTDGGYRQVYNIGQGFIAVNLGMKSLLITSLTVTYVADRDNYLTLTN